MISVLLSLIFRSVLNGSYNIKFAPTTGNDPTAKIDTNLSFDSVHFNTCFFCPDQNLDEVGFQQSLVRDVDRQARYFHSIGPSGLERFDGACKNLCVDQFHHIKLNREVNELAWREGIGVCVEYSASQLSLRT